MDVQDDEEPDMELPVAPALDHVQQVTALLIKCVCHLQIKSSLNWCLIYCSCKIQGLVCCTFKCENQS